MNAAHKLKDRLRQRGRAGSHPASSGADALPTIETSEVTIPSIPADLVSEDLGAWADAAGVVLEPVQAVWWRRGDLYDVLSQARRGCARVGLQFHGGGYVIGSARDVRSGGSRIPRGLVEHDVCVCVLSLDYSLVVTRDLDDDENHSFPLQIMEALSAFHYLVHDLDIPSTRIVLVGDSAGAHLALALQRYLLQSNSAHLPGGVILLSPWCDLSVEGHVPHVQRLLGMLPLEHLSTPYFSPALHPPPARWPPTLVYYGAQERFAPSIASLVSRLAEGGASVASYSAEEIPERFSHDFLIFTNVASTWPVAVLECWERMKTWVHALGTMECSGRPEG